MPLFLKCHRNKINTICCFLKKHTKPNLTHSQIHILVDATSRRLGFNGKTKRSGVQFYWIRILFLNLASMISYFFALCVQIFFSLYCTIIFFIILYSAAFEIFCFNGSLNVFVILPMLKSESNETWQFQCLRTRDFTTGYRNIWVGTSCLNVQPSKFSQMLGILWHK